MTRTADRRVAKVVELMTEQYGKRWTVESMADVVHLSPDRLRHLFVRDCGEPPAAYLRKLRLKKAQHLLLTTELSVKQVAAKVGFEDRSHFNAAFRKRFACSPGSLRRHSPC